ncbi:S41 family peptidase [Flaviaesturariibacter aridisoli]|nr:S41 family peptidase [Flaviaesturariibacter aridisoli]
MRFFLSAFLLVLAGQLRAQSIPDSLTPAQVREDLDFVVRTIESMHPDPWHAISRAHFYRLRDSLAASVQYPVGSEEAYPLVARLCAALDEGHTHAWPTPLSKKIIDGKIPVFPVLLGPASEAGFPVLKDLGGDSALRPGDRITAINGQSTAHLFARFLRFYGGMDAWRRSRLQNDLLVLLQANGIHAPYIIRYVRNGRSGTVQRSALRYAEFKARRDAFRKTRVQPKQADYSFERLPGSIGLLNVNTMEGDPQAFLKFLEDTFTVLQQQPVKGLVIDLRRNGGGNSLFGWYLLNFITSKPLRMSGDVYWKMSPQVRDWYRGLDSARRSGPDSAKWARYLAHADGDIIVLPASAPEAPEANALRFEGPVAVLIGPHTFSSANMTAATISDYHLATLIGEPTGEPANDYGEVLYFDTPNARVNFGSCTKLFTRPNGNRTDNNPVLPDISVKTVPGATGDAVLEAAQRWIRHGKPDRTLGSKRRTRIG